VITTQYPRHKLQCFDKHGAIEETSDYVKKYGPLFWMRMYYCIRCIEEGIPMRKKQLDKNIKRFYNLYRIQGLDKTVYAINEEVNLRLINTSKTKRHKMMQHDPQKRKREVIKSTGNNNATAKSSGGNMTGGY
jgi:hypothetical protein